MSCPLDNLNDPATSGAFVLQKIGNMIASNVFVIIVLILLVLVLLFGLYYFVTSLIQTLSNYYTLTNQKPPSVSDSLKDKSADNEYYPNPAEDEDEEALAIPVDPAKFMPKSKRDFLKRVEQENKEYNEEKTNLMTRRLNYPENDDIVDSRILYKDYDDYTYNY
jgi:hypothetical protein